MKSSIAFRVTSILLSAFLASRAIGEERQKFDAWRRSMERVPFPKKGCFKASYPGTEWREVTCTAAPTRPRRG